MAYILSIHSATETAIVNISENEQVLHTMLNTDTKEHAAFLHVAISQLLQKSHLHIKSLNAVAVTCGPGSYTGIRVGIATAKGLCYALNAPLIFLNSLELMAYSLIQMVKDPDALYCPMIDARRMEVFTALYNHEMKIVLNPAAIILDKNSFTAQLKNNKIYFSGSGSKKLANVTTDNNARFTTADILSDSLAVISSNKFHNKTFENIGYAQPLYLKEFYSLR